MSIKKCFGDNEQELKTYLRDSILPGPIDLQIERPMGFWRPYELQANHFSTYALRNDEEKIRGMATLLSRKGWLQNSYENIAFLSDTRLSAQKSTIAEWASELLNLLYYYREEQGVSYFFSVLSRLQGEAFSSLVRPRITRKNIPRYYLLRNFYAVWILGKLPLISSPMRTLEIRSAQKNDFEALANYLKHKSKGRVLSFDYTPELLYERLQFWPGLNEFWIALDSDKNIVGCVAPWNASQVQQYRIANFNGAADAFRTLVSTLSLLGITKSFAGVGETLNFQYLTHFYANNADIFYALLHKAYEKVKKNEFLVYTHYEKNAITTPPKEMISVELPLALYTILPHGEDLPHFLRTNPMTPPPELEIALL